MKKRLIKSLGGVLVSVLLTNEIFPINVMADSNYNQESEAGRLDGDEGSIEQETEREEKETSEGNCGGEPEVPCEESKEESEAESREESKEGTEAESGGESSGEDEAESEEESKEESEAESEDESREQSESGAKQETEGAFESEAEETESAMDNLGDMAVGDGQPEEDFDEEKDNGISADTNGWVMLDGKYYWYVEGERQGTEGRGEELYDPEADAWYWLDAEDDGARAVSRDVFLWAEDSVEEGRWVRYDENGQMVRGWSDEKAWYFDPINGAMAKGLTIIDGIEYEFDAETGRRITRIGFEEFGLVCNVSADEEYEYVTRTYRDRTLPTVAKTKFAYTAFTEDENHEAKEGYEWKQVTISLTYDDKNALEYGCCWSLLYNLDYYNFMDEPIEDFHTEDVVKNTEKIVFQGIEYDIEAHYTVKENWRDENDATHVVISFECHVPAEYDGMVIALYDTAYSGEDVELLARLNESSLLFRME